LIVLLVGGVARAQFADTTQGLGLTLGPVDLSLHGYFRAPLRLAWRDRGMGAGYNIHTPWLVDDDYFNSGFAYTRIQESDWSELYFNVGNQYVTGTVALMGSLYSDWAKPLLDRQWGIAQGYLTFHWQSEGPKLKFKLQVRGGAFWDRFGWFSAYDTYLFGRTHQMGGQVRFDFALDRVSFWLVQGVGAHLESIDTNQGLTILDYVHAGIAWRVLRAGFYFLDAFSQDKRQLKEIQDADERVYGFDLLVEHPLVGRLWGALSHVGADQATYLSPAIEVLHSFGGRGLTENYLGTEKSDNGTGGLWSIAFEDQFSARALLGRYAPARLPALRGGDVMLHWFGLYTYVNSHQDDPNPAINRNQRAMFKWGVEGGWRVLSFLDVWLRYDRVILDVQDDANSFRILTPRIAVGTRRWHLDAEIDLQYSHYFYGARIALRPGQVALETQPDSDVFKIQAQMAF
jgi:hypothetical protein